MSNKNHYDKIRKTFHELSALRTAIDETLAQCINELNKEPVNVNCTIEELRKQRTEMDELANTPHKVRFDIRKPPVRSPQQQLFDLKEELSKIIQNKDLDK